MTRRARLSGLRFEELEYLGVMAASGPGLGGGPFGVVRVVDFGAVL